MQKIRILLGVVTTLAALSACNSNPPAGNDSGMSTADTGGTDTGSTVDTGASTGGTCTAPININTMGMALATGTGRTIASTNATAAMAPPTGLAQGSCATDFGGNPTGVNEVVFQYTMQSGGYLRASTDNPATTAMLDTIVWILDGCTAAANELGCADDVDMTTLTSVADSTAPIASGTTVFIVVAGYDGADVSTGAFTLSVTEIMPHAAGEACDAVNPFCADPTTCVVAPGATSGHCNANGTEYAPCNLAAPLCDTGLQCSEAAPTADMNGTCQTPIVSGGVCTADHIVCVANNTCVADPGSTTMGHCLVDGSDNGICRLTSPFCDTGLQCSETAPAADQPGVCQVPIAGGAACTTTHFVCVTGFSCQMDDGSMTDGHCLADGAEYGACRLTGMACDTGLTCSETAPTAAANGTCQMPIASGGVCTPRHFLCVTGVSCIADAGSTTMGHCITDGAMGGACRPTMPECDGTLMCDMDGLCN